MAEWDRWRLAEFGAHEKLSGTHGLAFYMGLEKDKPKLLDFPAAGDKWQIVHGWLLKAGEVSD